MEQVYLSEKEQQQMSAFKWEHKMNFQREQILLENEAKQKGENFVPSQYVEVSDETALAAVRAGWKSGLDKQFDKKRKREAARGINWGEPFKIK